MRVKRRIVSLKPVASDVASRPMNLTVAGR